MKVYGLKRDFQNYCNDQKFINISHEKVNIKIKITIFVQKNLVKNRNQSKIKKQNRNHTSLRCCYHGMSSLGTAVMYTHCCHLLLKVFSLKAGVVCYHQMRVELSGFRHCSKAKSVHRCGTL